MKDLDGDGGSPENSSQLKEPTSQNEYWNVGGPRTYSQVDIDSAIAAGIFTAETASLLKKHVTREDTAPVANEEYFRLVSGFNDIFVVIASTMVLVAIGWLTNELIVALAAWGLSEYFVRIKHLALTAIVLLVGFSGSVFLWVTQITLSLLSQSDSPTEPEHFIVAGLLTAVATWLHWKRFRVPITVVCGTAASLCCFISILLTIFPSLLESHMIPIIFFAGLVVLVLAMVWDSSDIYRQTRRSDVAFWLHLLAAPLLVHPIFEVLGVFGGPLAPSKAVVVVAMYGVLAFISLCLDRRALMVSSLAYVLYAFGVLFKEYEGLQGLNLAASALVIGSALLLLAAWWQPVRVWSLNLLPPQWLEKLPPA